MIKDQAGVVTNTAYDFKGNLAVSRRELAENYKTRFDWNAYPEPALDSCHPAYESTTTYDALNRPVDLIQPDQGNSRICYVYNEAGLMDSISVNIGGQEPARDKVKNMGYNARGQKTRVEHGNGAIIEYTYEEDTFRLLTLTTTRRCPFCPSLFRFFLFVFGDVF